MRADFWIGARGIGASHPVLVIAEIGVNHDGSLERALQLVDAAAAAGADAVKLQIFRATTLLHGSSSFAAYQRAGSAEPDPAAMLRRYELPAAALGEIVAAIRGRGMLPLATPFSVADVDVIRELNLPAVKVASPDLVNRPLLERVADLRRPVLVSTGAATMAEALEATGWLRAWGNPFALLHCVSSYPTAPEDARLSWIGELGRECGALVGYSDHTTEIVAGALAVAAGAVIVEKHLTHDRAAPGPDHAASADPEQFAQYVRAVRLAETLRGRAGKCVLAAEADVRRVSRQSVVLARAVRAGERLVTADLIVQRPGTGIPAAMRDTLVGLRAARPLAAGTLLQWDMLQDAA